jgi:tripartite-type tricarboxylate transporter receptor subunit TctC
MKQLVQIAAACTLAACTALACAEYPEKPVKIVVPFAPGGTVDFTARVISQSLAEQLGKAFIVENRTGATGTIANAAVARSAADGYTLMLADTSIAMVPSLFKQLSFDVTKDFAPISLVISTPLVLIVPASLNVASLKDLIAQAKANPGKLNYGSGGIGSSTHLGAEMFRSAAAVDIVHVPYKGAGDAMQAVLGGQVQILVTALPTALPHIKSGKARALAVTSSGKRSAALPEIPTAAEAGLPAFTVANWFGLVAPAGTPREIVDKLNAAVVKALANAQVRERFTVQGGDPVGNSPAEFGKLIRDEIPRWAGVIKSAGVAPE